MKIVPSICSRTIPILFFFFFSCFMLQFCLAADTLFRGQSITGSETLVSAGEIFELGFFSPGILQNRYLGIWYKKISAFTVVWVANRQNPLTDSSSGVLKITNDGNLVVLDGRNTTLWSANSSFPANSNSTAKLLDSGNLVLMDGNTGQTLWQSFDYPSDTLLPGMKVGVNLKSRHPWFLRSWKTSDDPSLGNFSMVMDVRQLPEFFIMNGLNPYWRSGSWNGAGWSGIPEMYPEHLTGYDFINNKDEIYFTYYNYNSSIISRFTLDESGVYSRYTWQEWNQRWILYWSAPRDQCQKYGACGAFGTCSSDNSTFCKCLPGFEPKSHQDWDLRDWSGGCVRRRKLMCGERDGFLKLNEMKLPETSVAEVDESLSLEDCKAKCLNNCSYTAYANSDIRGGGSGCVIWSGNLMDVRELPGGQEFYLRVASSELDGGGDGRQKGSSTKKIRTIAISLAATLSCILLFVWCGFIISKRKKKIKGAIKALSYRNKLGEDEGVEKGSALLFLDFSIIEEATSNFSFANKLGEGGFGSVYKGELPNGKEIAVKRLSKSSGQGIDEFENEVMLIAKLQQRNLVRLLGYCTHAEEKILIYEYMSNKSLDTFLFDQTKSALLDWRKRFHIIVGIARGLLYLHEDSRLKVIHRDLKSSNILLDSELNPKISDFGMARIFRGNQSQENTKKVVGTYGYMSPEYAMNGHFSVKSDVFSFGVLVLEIVSGKKINGFYHSNDSLSLIGYGWELWKDGTGIEFMDPSMANSFIACEVLRCINIGLLCVEEFARDRPTMSSVVFMLGSETKLPEPKRPAFSIGIGLTEANPCSGMANSRSINNVSLTTVEAR